jgi:3-hydroxyisobutyrate dehydrogenase-like beta-hydroxyacid dehydrogenase
MSTPRPAIGFIGLGLMGSRMASRLLNAGYPLTVFDLSDSNAQALARHGATVALSPRLLAERVDVVMLSVPDGAAVEQAILGPDGAIGALAEGKTVIDMSTIAPSTSRSVAHQVAATGASMLDAPVSGSTPVAEQGALIILVGGNRDIFAQHRPILEVLGKEIFYLGTNGNGLVMKLVANALLGLGMQALAEGIVLGEKGGLDRNELLDVLSHLAVVPPAFKTKLEMARRNEYPEAFPLHYMNKDFGLIAQLAQDDNYHHKRGCCLFHALLQAGKDVTQIVERDLAGHVSFRRVGGIQPAIDQPHERF